MPENVSEPSDLEKESSRAVAVEVDEKVPWQVSVNAYLGFFFIYSAAASIAIRLLDVHTYKFGLLGNALNLALVLVGAFFVIGARTLRVR